MMARNFASVTSHYLSSAVLAGLCGLLIALTAPATSADEAATGWDSVGDILAEIRAPEFPDREFNITDFGAKSDGKTDCKSSIDQAIRECHEVGGGKVVVPAGDWRVNGPIHLLSNVNLHLDADATILFSTEPNDYLPAVYTRFEGTELMNYSPLIYAFEQENIAVTGEGTLDGQASAEAWWPWKGPWGGSGKIVHGWKEGDPNQLDAIERLIGMADDNVPTEERVFGDGHYLRPNFVQPYRSKNVLIEGITIKNSPMWVLHPVLCENVTVRGVKVVTHGPNNDGCNPESSRNVLIEDCYFDTGDDCIAIKSGRNNDGRRIGVPSENIIIRGCTMKDGHGGVVMGSEMSGGIRNVFAEDCYMDSPHLDRVVRLKSNSMRGGYLENMFVRNIKVGTVGRSLLCIDLLYFRETGDHVPYVRNIFIENVTVENCKGSTLNLRGLAEQPIKNIVIENTTVYSAQQPNIIENVEQITLKNFNLFPSSMSRYVRELRELTESNAQDAAEATAQSPPDKKSL